MDKAIEQQARELSLPERLLMEAEAWESWNAEFPKQAAVTTPPLLREAARVLESAAQAEARVGGEVVCAVCEEVVEKVESGYVPRGHGVYSKPFTAPPPSAEPPYEIDALFDALSNLEHDNYERSYSGSKNREADAGLIRAALERYVASVATHQQPEPGEG